MRYKALVLIASLLLSAHSTIGSHPGAEIASEEARTRPLRIVHARDVPTLDPHLDLTYICTSVLGNLFDALVAFDADGVPAARLAQAWERPDDLTWRFTLRKGVRFHNNKGLTADDVVATLRRAKEHPLSKMAAFLAAVEKVEADGEHVVVVHTRSPDPTLLNKLVFVYIVPVDTPEKLDKPIGTGPYRLVDHEPGDRLRMAAFKRYWGQQPA
ncbi:MAG: hypothetical protein GY906_17580, partial [bacterium]|nr:hypothetical protein [bacterium]